jgi:protein-tyrosine-phosphatase
MAEAFARAYGSDVLEARSAGLMPADFIAPMTKQILAEWNLNIDDHFSKGLEAIESEHFDMVVNMSGQPLRVSGADLLTWVVRDPIGQSESVYRSVVQQIEGLVMGLILNFRSRVGRTPSSADRPPGRS